MSEIHDCGGDAAAYVLGALEPAEAEEYRRHLERCAACREEVHALEGVVRALPMAAPQHPAPRALRRRVFQAIRDEPHGAGAPVHARRPSRVRRPALAALALAAVVALVLLAVNPGGGGGTRVIQAHVAGISGAAELRVSGGRGELIVQHLSPPPPGHVYEIWLQRARGAPAPTSALFSVTSAGAADVGVPGSLRGVARVLVTPEPDGGSLVPTHSPVIIAPLT